MTQHALQSLWLVAVLVTPSSLLAQQEKLEVNEAVKRAARHLELAEAAGKRYQKGAKIEDREAACRELRATLGVLDRAKGAIHDGDVMVKRWTAGQLAGGLLDWSTALRAWGKVCEFYRLHPPKDPKWARIAKAGLAQALGNSGKPEKALEIQRERLEACASLPADSDERVDALWDVASTLGILERNKTAQDYWKQCIEILRGKPEKIADLHQAQLLRAQSLHYLGRMRDAAELMEKVSGSYGDPKQAKHPIRLQARQVLARSYKMSGKSARARAIYEDLLRIQEGLGKNRPDYFAALKDLAMTYGNTKEALDLADRAIAGLVARVPEDDVRLLTAQWMRAQILTGMGRLDEAFDEYGKLGEVYRKNEGTEWERLLNVRMLQGKIMRLQGRVEASIHELAAAYEDFTKRHAGETRQHSFVHNVYAELAFGHRALGHYATAIGLMEQALRWRSKLLHEDAYELQMTRDELAQLKLACGDHPGAQVLLEQIVRSYERSLDEDAHAMQDARIKLARCMWQQGRNGERGRAIRLTQKAIAALERGPKDKTRTLQLARLSLAGMLVQQGRLDEARALCQRAIETGGRDDARDIPVEDLASARLGEIALAEGKAGTARRLLEKALARLRARPKEYAGAAAELGQVRRSFLFALSALRDEKRLGRGIASLLDETEAELDNLLALSRRELGETTRRLAADLDLALSLPRKKTGPLAVRTFELLETVRAVSSSGLPIADRPGAEGNEVRALRAAVLKARERLHELLAAREDAMSEDAPAGITPPSVDQLADANRERDRAEKALKKELGSAGHSTGHKVELAALSRSVPYGSAAVSFYRYRSWKAGKKKVTSEDRLLAHVVRSDGSVRRVELGPAESIRRLAEDWREALIGGTRGRRPGAKTDPAAATGKKLRAEILGKLEPAIGKARTLYLCLDDVLHAVPFDALPARKANEKGAHVLDEYTLVQLPSLDHLTRKAAVPASGRPLLVAFGGIDFEADPGKGPALQEIVPAPASVARGGGPKSEFWPPLTSTKREVKTIAAMFESKKQGDSRVVTGADATKSEFRRLAPRARYLLLATHGYFAEDSVSPPDTSPDDAAWVRRSFEQTIEGFAPMTLCGLVFAGANRGKDARSRVPGILTGEELAGLDLGRCELAVLSACETNAGVLRAGQGLHSLQAALHAAGARSAVTSLWKVDDDATETMMKRFYELQWLHGKSVAEALRSAKKTLRRSGVPVKDWAAWVMTGRG